MKLTVWDAMDKNWRTLCAVELHWSRAESTCQAAPQVIPGALRVHVVATCHFARLPAAVVLLAWIAKAHMIRNKRGSLNIRDENKIVLAWILAR